MVKNPPANAGDMGSIPDPRRSHMQPEHHDYQARTPKDCPPQQEKPPQQEAPALQPGIAPAPHNRDGLHATTKTQQPKINKSFLKNEKLMNA